MINLKSISKRFGTTEAVKHISLSIQPGEIVGLLGPNGAGKTTTLRMLAGTLPPTTGSILIDQKPFSDDEYGLKSRIGYLPENNPLYEDVTVEEHLQFWARMKAIPEEKRREAIDFAVEKTGIAAVYYRFISELSKGYRQRVGLAQAILNQPDILILDEPTEGLDPNQRRSIESLLAELKESRTVIVSSHVLSEVAELANRIIIIHKGEVVGDDTPGNLTKNREGIQELIIEVEGRGVAKGLKSLTKVTKVTKEDSNTYRLICESATDLRPAVFRLAVKEGWTLLATRIVERRLEDVFLELTEGA
jgi:ABC-2 type transport system ATP-binding protein